MGPGETAYSHPKERGTEPGPESRFVNSETQIVFVGVSCGGNSIRYIYGKIEPIKRRSNCNRDDDGKYTRGKA
ncbi:MAG: hypothetical protein A3H27_09250 [Acidobacteria bacterium RIFCSPLOWO2_02_FULL_59_13]|nr:MAG: hypothetical protein A3H27_09250 [Acidobacteria bacterium RIFCSPLOWO2_02_FULL_59_13]